MLEVKTTVPVELVLISPELVRSTEVK